MDMAEIREEILKINNLWKAALMTLLEDITSGKEDITRYAIPYLDTKDFTTICDLAGLNAERMRSKFKELIKR